MKVIIILFMSIGFISSSEQELSGVYVSDGEGYYFRINEERYQYLSIAADNANVLCQGNITIKEDTLFFNNDFSLRGSNIFCDSIEFGVIQSNTTFFFRNKIYNKKTNQDELSKKKRKCKMRR